MTVTTILDEIARKMGDGWVTTPASGTLAQMEYAVTNAGRAACMWEGRDWWWLHATGSFPTADTTASYALRTVNTNNMASLWAVTRAYWGDDQPIAPISYEKYRDLSLLSSTSGNATVYAVAAEPPVMYLYPTPSSVETVYVDYVKFHADIEDDSAAGLLLIPAQFHYPVYVDGAVFLLQNGLGDPAQLAQSPAFCKTMERMAIVDPTNYDGDNPENKHPDATGGTWPNNKRVWFDGVRTLIMDNP